MSRRGRLLLISLVVSAAVLAAVLFHSRGDDAGNLIALDAGTGRQVWRSHVPAAEFLRVSDGGGPVEVDAWARFAECDFGEVHLTVDTATGHVLGKPTRVKETDDIELSDGGVHFRAARSPALLNITASSQPGGALLWRRTVGKADLSAGSEVLVLNNENLTDFSVLDARTGKTLWGSRAPLTRGVPGGGDGRVYLVTTGHVQAVDSRTGVAQWRAPATPGKGTAPTGPRGRLEPGTGRGRAGRPARRLRPQWASALHDRIPG